MDKSLLAQAPAAGATVQEIPVWGVPLPYAALPSSQQQHLPASAQVAVPQQNCLLGASQPESTVLKSQDRPWVHWLHGLLHQPSTYSLYCNVLPNTSQLSSKRLPNHAANVSILPVEPLSLTAWFVVVHFCNVARGRWHDCDG